MKAIAVIPKKKDSVHLTEIPKPNVEGLNLDKSGVQFDAREGLQVNDRLQTSIPGSVQ